MKITPLKGSPISFKSTFGQYRVLPEEKPKRKPIFKGIPLFKGAPRIGYHDKPEPCQPIKPEGKIKKPTYTHVDMLGNAIDIIA